MYDLKLAAEITFGEQGFLARSDINIQDGFYYLNNLFPLQKERPMPGG